MAACYDPAASFHDIAFDLFGRLEIHCMWHMICEGDIRATFEVLQANDKEGRVRVTDTYTFGADKSKDPPKPGRTVRNKIDSRFVFQNGWIIKQNDDCDPAQWAQSALGGLLGFVAGRSRLLRKWKARRRLNKFLRKHPEYRSTTSPWLVAPLRLLRRERD
jgi:hypothetical protein